MLSNRRQRLKRRNGRYHTLSRKPLCGTRDLSDTLRQLSDRMSETDVRIHALDNLIVKISEEMREIAQRNEHLALQTAKNASFLHSNMLREFISAGAMAILLAVGTYLGRVFTRDAVVFIITGGILLIAGLTLSSMTGRMVEMNKG